MKNFRKHQRNGNATGTIVGIVVLIIGIVIYGNRQGFVSDELRHLIFSWPMLVTALGTILLVSSRFILGSILFVFGIASLIPNLKLLYPSQFDFLPTYSPINFDGSLFIILAGLFLIFSHIFRSGHSKKNIKIEFTNGDDESSDESTIDNENSTEKNTTYSSGNYIKQNVLFNGIRQVVLAPEFKGGNLNVLFGGIEIDLRRTTIPVGETTIKADILFGGLNIYVPEDCNVVFYNSGIFSGINDKRSTTSIMNKSERTLIIKSNLMFAGGEIKN